MVSVKVPTKHPIIKGIAIFLKILMQERVYMLNIGNLLISNLDYILIVDKNYKIIYNTRYDALINDKSTEYVWGDVMGKNFFEVIFVHFSIELLVNNRPNP